MPRIARPLPHRRRPSRRAAPLVALVALAGCTEYGTREFGVRRDVQGQTRVTSPPPLSLPPVLTERVVAHADRPPAASGDDATVSDGAARSGPHGGPARTEASRSAAEDSLLAAAGPSAPGDIRRSVDQDAQIGRADPSETDAILFGPSTERNLIQRGPTSWFGRLF